MKFVIVIMFLTMSFSISALEIDVLSCTITDTVEVAGTPVVQKKEGAVLLEMSGKSSYTFATLGDYSCEA